MVKLFGGVVWPERVELVSVFGGWRGQNFSPAEYGPGRYRAAAGRHKE